MQKIVITKDFKETQALGEKLAKEFGQGIICLEGELGSGKTTFTQGFLKGLLAKGPYTSPTFVIMKKYDKPRPVYHIDAYRVGEKDILNLGWEEIVSKPENIVIVEWPERIKNIIPVSAKWVRFKWLGENEREVKVD